jgi:hypothetical protein
MIEKECKDCGERWFHRECQAVSCRLGDFIGVIGLTVVPWPPKRRALLGRFSLKRDSAMIEKECV